MPSVRVNGVVAAVLAVSLFGSSTAAVAAGAPSLTMAAPVQVSPWVALTGLTAGAPAAALCGTAATTAAAVQAPAGGCVLPAIDTPPPVADPGGPAVPPAGAAFPAVGAPVGVGISPLFVALGVLAAGAFVYFVAANHHHEISPR